MTTGQKSWLTLATHVSADGGGGGMIRYTVEFIRAMARREDVDMHVLAHPRAHDFFAGILGDADHVHLTPDLPVAAVSLFERYALPPSLRGFDVVHGTKHLLPAGPVRGRKVLTCHDMLPLDRPGDFGQAKRTLLRRPYLASLADADSVVCVSEATRQRAMSYVPSIESTSHVVGLASNALYDGTEGTAVPSLEGGPFVLVVGDDSPRKNLRLIVRAMVEVARTRPDAVLAIAGPPSWGIGEDATLLDVLVAQGNAVRLGFVTDDELRWCYSNAALVCCPALLEGFGLPAQEALTFGAPLLTSDDPALCEVSADAALHLSSWNSEEWVQPILDQLERGRPDGRPAATLRTWDDVARETLEAAL